MLLWNHKFLRDCLRKYRLFWNPAKLRLMYLNEKFKQNLSRETRIVYLTPYRTISHIVSDDITYHIGRYHISYRTISHIISEIVSEKSHENLSDYIQFLLKKILELNKKRDYFFWKNLDIQVSMIVLTRSLERIFNPSRFAGI